MSNYISTSHFLRCLQVSNRADGEILRMCSILRMLIEDSPRPEKGVALLVEFRRISGLPMPIVLEGMITEYNTARSRRVHDYLSRGAPARHFNDPYPYSQDTFLIDELCCGLSDLVSSSEE
ncbi:hypothetical protein KQX54_016053 [Cotesia glomerata]|uniref:Uncharacterized protein n=1 Tax=Cotesia glomerata TaxID=32391 RepID=A0AAV7IID0_COTGL|nr:hypothetical protein KQX54_016053 [Cotesia glomerata]